MDISINSQLKMWIVSDGICIPQEGNKFQCYLDVDFRLIQESQLNLQTCKEEHFIIGVDPAKGIIVFSCFTNLHFLCSVETVYMDGTFQFRCHYFSEMFTIHGFQNNIGFFLLLPYKKCGTYISLFNFLRQKCCELNL